MATGVSVLTAELPDDRTREVQASGESNSSNSLATENESEDKSVDMDSAERHAAYGSCRASRQLMPQVRRDNFLTIQSFFGHDDGDFALIGARTMQIDNAIIFRAQRWRFHARRRKNNAD